MNSFLSDDNSGENLDVQLPSIDDLANMGLKGHVEATMQAQLKDLGATFEKGMSVLKEFHKILHENPKMKGSGRSVDELLCGRAGGGSLREKKELQHQNDQLKKYVDELEKKVQDLEEKLDAQPAGAFHDHHFSNPHRNVNEFQAKESEQNQKNLEEQIAKLREDLEASEKSASESKKRCDDLEDQLTHLRLEKQKLEEQQPADQLTRQNLEQQVTKLTNDCYQLAQQVHGLNLQLAAVEKEKQDERSGQIPMSERLRSTEEQLVMYMQENANYKTELQRVNTDYSVQVEQVEQLKRQVEQLQEEVECAKLAHEASLKEAYLKVCKEIKIKKPDNVNTMEEVRQWTQKELQNVVKERAKNGNKVQELEGEIEDQKKQLQREQKERESAVKTLQDQLTAKMGEIDALKQQVHDKTVEMETLRQQMLDETAEKTRFTELEGQNNEMKRSLRQAEDCKQLLQKRLKKNDQQAEDLRGHIAELEKKQKGWSDACNDLDRVVKEKDAEIARLNNENNELKGDVMRLKQANKGSLQSPTTTGRDSPAVIVDEVPDDVMGFIRRSQTKRPVTLTVTEFACVSCAEKFKDEAALHNHMQNCIERWD